MDSLPPLPDRRDLLRLVGGGAVAIATGTFLGGCGTDAERAGAGGERSAGSVGGSRGGSGASTPAATRPTGPFGGYGPLAPPDGNGVRLPEGFTSRVVATSGEPVPGTRHVWHANPDGGACFARAGGGWIYVSNSETGEDRGGAGAIEFSADGAIVAARSVLSGTNGNCAGGATPWGTWLSCEEIERGEVWECDPTGATPARSRPAMGRCSHEAVAVDPVAGHLYLTEDELDGALYRFTPARPSDLSAGTLEVLTERDGVRAWARVPDPAATTTPTRHQVEHTRTFDGGEGIVHHGDAVFFTTKYDNRVWRLGVADLSLSIVYDAAAHDPLVLSVVDNITATAPGDLYVCEDAGDMQVVLLSGSVVAPVFGVPGITGSELAGAAFSPDGHRFYVSSQRNPGTTYEVTGPWRTG